MAIKWTTTRNERLLLLIVGEVKVNPAKLAEAWAKQYGDDDFQPTARAISEQFGVLKKKAGVKGGGVKSSNGISTPKTPRTTTNIPKNSASRATSASKPKAATPSKRKKSTMSSSSSDDDENGDDDDDDSEPDVRYLPKSNPRASLSRSKKVPKRYEDPASPSEDESLFKLEKGAANEDGEEIHVAKPEANRGELDGIMSELMAAGTEAGKEGGESDVSDFAHAF